MYSATAIYCSVRSIENKFTRNDGPNSSLATKAQYFYAAEENLQRLPRDWRGRYNAPRIFANQLCALSVVKQSATNEARTEPGRGCTLFFPTPGPFLSRSTLLFVLLLFVLQTQLVQSTLAVRRRGIIMAQRAHSRG